MTEKYITLLGAEDVRSAASTMRHAAGEMQSAASSIASAFQANERFMDDWLQRFQHAIGEAMERKP